MALSYKKLWKQLIDHDMNRADLREATGLSPATLAKMSKGDRICRTLQCNIGDLVDYIPDESVGGGKGQG